LSFAPPPREKRRFGLRRRWFSFETHMPREEFTNNQAVWEMLDQSNASESRSFSW
jgi:hypothetical protein